MSKLFIFPNKDATKDVYDFTKELYERLTNIQDVINKRFESLIREVCLNISEGQVSDSNVESRKSYLIQNDFEQDLIECQCDKYFDVKSGNVTPNKFIINT
jgi:hypothetical protein